MAKRIKNETWKTLLQNIYFLKYPFKKIKHRLVFDTSTCVRVPYKNSTYRGHQYGWTSCLPIFKASSSINTASRKKIHRLMQLYSVKCFSSSSNAGCLNIYKILNFKLSYQRTLILSIEQWKVKLIELYWDNVYGLLLSMQYHLMNCN